MPIIDFVEAQKVIDSNSNLPIKKIADLLGIIAQTLHYYFDSGKLLKPKSRRELIIESFKATNNVKKTAKQTGCSTGHCYHVLAKNNLLIRFKQQRLLDFLEKYPDTPLKQIASHFGVSYHSVQSMLSRIKKNKSNFNKTIYKDNL